MASCSAICITTGTKHTWTMLKIATPIYAKATWAITMTSSPSYSLHRFHALEHTIASLAKALY